MVNETYLTMRSQEKQFLTNEDIFRPQPPRNIFFHLNAGKLIKACFLQNRSFCKRYSWAERIFSEYIYTRELLSCRYVVSTMVKKNTTRATELQGLEYVQLQFKSLTFWPQSLKTIWILGKQLIQGDWHGWELGKMAAQEVPELTSPRVFNQISSTSESAKWRGM